MIALLHDNLFCKNLLTNGYLDNVDTLRPSCGGDCFRAARRRLRTSQRACPPVISPVILNHAKFINNFPVFTIVLDIFTFF